jgi:hypothetical protein
MQDGKEHLQKLRLEVAKAVKMSIMVFWVVTLCCLVKFVTNAEEECTASISTLETTTDTFRNCLL